MARAIAASITDGAVDVQRPMEVGLVGSAAGLMALLASVDIVGFAFFRGASSLRMVRSCSCLPPPFSNSRSGPVKVYLFVHSF